MVKSYVISVSLGTGCYRHIQISASATLKKLHSIILAAFSFSDDHQHAFFMSNRLWTGPDAYFSTEFAPDTTLTEKKKLSQLRLKKGDKFKYLFDFGDEWVFQCKVLRELDTATDIPGVIRSIGAAPEQYPESLDSKSAFPSILPQEQVEELFTELPLSQKLISGVHQYFDAAARLYGIVPLHVIYKLYNDQNPSISEENFLSIAEIVRHEANGYCILGAEALYSEMPPADPMDREIIALPILEIGSIDLYYDLTDMQGDKPFMALPKEQFLRYADPLYLPETKPLHAMRQFLQKNKRRLSIPVDEVLYTIYMALWLDLPMQYTADGLEEIGFQFQSPAEIRSFADLYQELNNHTRKIANRGASPKELLEFYAHKKKEQFDARHVLRNPNQLSLLDEDM